MVLAMSNLGNKQVMKDNLNRIMKERGLSQKRVADDLGIVQLHFLVGLKVSFILELIKLN